MATEGVDIASLQDEDLLRRMWQETEDLSRKKEIRARMYKLREQRLKEFYTTGEVLLDVQRATPQSHEIIESSEDLVENLSLIPVTTPTKTIMTHTDSIKDRGFMTMKSQEIRDSEFPSSNQSFRGNDSDGQSYWKVESSSESYQAVGRDGQYEITSQSQNRNMAGENDRIVMDSGYATENKSVMDRNGDMRVISSRAYDTSGRDMSSQALRGGDMNFGRGRGQDDFNDGNVRYLEDVNGGRSTSRSTSESKMSETRTSSSSHSSQKWSTDVKTSSSRVMSSSTTTREGSRYTSGTGSDVYSIEKFDDSDGKSFEPFDSGTQVSKHGTTEVSKTIIRGGKVITETVTYVDGKPVGTKTTTTIRDAPPETVTVIRGGKLIKEKVPSKKIDTQSTERSTTSDSRGNVQTFITTEKISTQSQKGGNTETVIKSDCYEPDSKDSDVPYSQATNGKPHPGQAPPQTKTVIRGGKVIKEKITSDVDDTKDFIRRESSTAERTSTSAQNKHDSVNRSSTVTESTTRTYETRGNHYSRDVPDDDYNYPGDRHKPDGRPRSDHQGKQHQPDQSRPDSRTPGQQRPGEDDTPDDDVYDRKSSRDSRTTTTKTITVIRGGKVMKQTVVEVDGKQVSDTGKQLQPHDVDGNQRSPKDDDTDRGVPKKSQPRDQDRLDRDTENIQKDKQVTVKTIKTVIRGGKLVKETVPVDDDDEYIYRGSDRAPDDDDDEPGKPRKGSPGTGRERPKGQKPKGDRPQDEHPDKERPHYDSSPRDDDDDTSIRVVKGSKTDIRKTTSQRTQQHSTEAKTVTVIRGGKIVKEKVTVTDDEDTDRNQRRSPDTPQKTRPAISDTNKKSSPEPDANRLSQKKSKPGSRPKKPSETHPGYEVPSDKEGSEYPSGSEAPDQEEEMPYKVVTVIRSGKVIKECVPISDDEVDDSNDRKPKMAKPAKGKPSDIQPVQGFPSTDRRKPSGKDQPEGKGKRPQGDSPDDLKPDSNKKGAKTGKPDDAPYGRPTSPSAPMDSDEHPDYDTVGSAKPRHQPKDEPGDDYPGWETPGKDGKKPQKSGSPKSPDKDQPKTGKPTESDTDERPVKTVTVIRGGKVITETVKMTDEEIRERKLMETRTKSTKKTTVDDVDFIEAEKPKRDQKPKEKPKGKPEDRDSDDEENRRDRPHGRKSPSPRDKPENLTEKEFIQREKSTGVKTVTVIRSGKIIKEVVPVDDDESVDEQGSPRRKATDQVPDGKPGTQKPKKTDRPTSDKVTGRPDTDSDDETKKPQSRQPGKEAPDRRKPSASFPDESGKRPQYEMPDEYDIKPQDGYPSRKSPDKSGRHPQEGTPGKGGKEPKDDSNRQFPGKTDGRPGESFPESKRPHGNRPDEPDRQPEDEYIEEEPNELSRGMPGRRPEDKPSRRSPNKTGRQPDDEYSSDRRPGDDQPGRPDRQHHPDIKKHPSSGHPQSLSERPRGSRPDDDQPDEYGRRQDHPVKFSPTTGKKPEDELRRQPNDVRPGSDDRKPYESQADRFSPTTGRRPEDEIKRQPSDLHTGSDSRKPHQRDRFSPTTGRRPEDELRRQPSDVRPDGRKPHDGQPDRFSPTTGRKPEDELRRQPSDVRPDGRKPHDGQPDRFSPTTGRKPEDELRRQPSDVRPDGRKPHDGQPDRFSPTTGRKPEDELRRQPSDVRPGSDSRKPQDSQLGRFSPATGRRPEDELIKQPSNVSPGDDGRKPHHGPDRFSPTTGRKPEDEFRRQPSDLRPKDRDERPHEGRPNERGRSPGDVHPASQHPEKDEYQVDKEFITREKSSTAKTITVIRGGKLVKETVTVDDDEPQLRKKPDKLHPKGDQPSDGKEKPQSKTPGQTEPYDRSRKPRDEQPNDIQRPRGGTQDRHPDDRTPGKVTRIPDDDEPEDLEPGRRPRDGKTPADRYPDKQGKRPQDNVPGKDRKQPKDDLPDRFSPNRTDRRPDDEYPEHKKPHDGRPTDDHPDHYGKRPQDKQPNRSGMQPEDYSVGSRPQDRRPAGSLPDDKTRRPGQLDNYGRFPDDKLTPTRFQDEPDRVSPQKMGKFPGEDYPEDRNRRPKDGRPEDGRPVGFPLDKRPNDDQPGSRRPYDNYPDHLSPGRRPEDFYPDQQGNKPRDNYPHEKPDGFRRHPDDDQPDEYGRIPRDRRPRDDYPDDKNRKPKDSKPDRVSPDKTGRRPNDRQPDRIAPGKRPDGKPDPRYPSDTKKRPNEPGRPGSKTPSVTKGKKPTNERIEDTHWTVRTDKVSIDVSASHAQFASSLRAPPLERPKTPTKPFDDYQSPQSTPSTRSATPRQMTRTPSRESTQKPRDKYPVSTPTKGAPQRPKSPWTDEPQYSLGRKPRRDDSPERITQRPSSKINDVISRLSCDTQSSKERRKLTSRQSRSSITKRTRTPGVSPSSSPSRRKPTSEEPRKRTTSSGSTSTASTERDSDFNYQRPDRPDSEIHRDTEITDFIRTERDYSRKIQKVQGVSPDDEDYNKPRDKSPSTYSDSMPRGTRAQEPKEYYPTGKKPNDEIARPRKPGDEFDDDDMPRKKKPFDRPEDDDHQSPSRPTTTSQSIKSPVSGRPTSPTDQRKPRSQERSPRSKSTSPNTSSNRKYPSDRSPQRRLHPGSPTEDLPDKRRKPKAPEKTTPLQKGTPDRPRKDLTEFPSQKRFPAKEKVPMNGKPSTKPGDRNVPGMPTHKKPDLSNTKPDTTKPWQRPQNGIPSKPDTSKYPKGTPTKAPDTLKKPKTPTSVQPEKTKGKPGVPTSLAPAGKKPVGGSPSTDKMPRGRRPSDKDDFSSITRRQTVSTTSTTVETRNFINAEKSRRPTSRKNIMDFDWNEDTAPEDFLVDNSSVSSQENQSPTGKTPRRPSSPGSKSKRPNEKPCPTPQGVKPGSKQPGKTPGSQAPKSPLDQPKGIPKNQQPDFGQPGKPGSKKKQPKRPGSESSENESDVDVPLDVEFVHGERKPQKIRDERYREQIDLIRREQETNYSTKVITSARESTQEEYTGKVEMPDSSRESTRSPDVNRPKCVPVNERDTEELRPRYADQVSEPDEEPEYGRRRPDKRTGLRPVEEESKKTLRDILVKTTLEKIDKIPDFRDVSEITEETTNVSVAERVNKFMETALKPSGTQPSRPEDITLKGLNDTINEFIQTNEFHDDVTDVQRHKETPTSVIKAKTMFETIANQTVVAGTAIRDLKRQDDILSRPSVLGPKSPRPKDSQPGYFDEEPGRRTPGDRPRSTDGKSPRGGRLTDEDDDDWKRTGSKPGTRDTSPKTRRDSPDRYHKSPGRGVYPEKGDDDERKPRRPQDHGRDSPSRRPDEKNKYDIFGTSPDRYPDGSTKKPIHSGDRSPDRYGSSPTRPGDRSPDRYDKISRKPGDRSPDRYDSPSKKPGDRSPDRYDRTSKSPRVRSPDRHDTNPRKPGDQSPDRYGEKPRKPGDRISDRYGSSPQRQGTRPSDRSPDRYGSAPQDKPKGRSPDRYGSSPSRPGLSSPDRYPDGSTKKPIRSGDRSPDRYGSSPTRPGDRSPDRYGKSPRKPRDRSPSRSPDRYNETLRKPSDRSPDRYDRSPDRYGRTPKSAAHDRSPDRFSSSPRRPGDRSPDRHGSTPKKSGDKPRGRSPDRYVSTPKKPSDRISDRDAPKKQPIDKTQSPKRSTPSTDKHGPTPKDKPKVKAPTPDRYGSVPGSTTKKPQDSIPRRPGDTSTPRDLYPGNKSPYTTPGREPKGKSQSPDRYGTHPSRPEDQDVGSRYSPSYATPGRPYSPSTYDRDRSPESRYSPTRSPYNRDTSPTFRSPGYSTPEPLPTKKSPSRELADQVRRMSSPKKDSPVTVKPEARYPYSKPSKTEPIKPLKTTGVVDKYSLMDYDKRTTTSSSTMKYTTSHTIPLFSSRPSPERKTKPLLDSKPKTNGYLMPEDDLLSPTFEKTKKIPENSSLKAPALLKKQNSQPDNLRYSTSIYKMIQDDDDDDRYSSGRKPLTSSLGSKPYTTTDTTKFSKFGVSLKKTTPGSNFIRKGPVDVGKKETELDRTYDLDLLTAMLERAKGYEERRLIRGQIRTVKTMIENNELTRVTDRRKPYGDDRDEPYRPMAKSPLKTSPDEYGPDGYRSYRTETTTTTEAHSYRTSSTDKFYPGRDDSPGRYPLKSTATLTLSPKGDSPVRRSPDKSYTSAPDRRSPVKSYPTTDYSDEPSRPGTKKYTPDREPVGKLIDSETRKLLKRPGSPKKGSPYQLDAYSVNKTIKKSHTEHETKETNLTDSIISSYGVGPTDEKGRPLFGLQALRRQKPKTDSEPADFRPKEPESPVDIKDSSGRAFFGLRALRAPKKDVDQAPESPTLKDLTSKYDSHSISSVRRRSLRGSPLSDDDSEFIRKEMDEDEVNRVMSEPGQSLKEMIKKHERLMEDNDDDDDDSNRRPDKTKTTSSSYSTSTVIRSSAVRRPDGTVSVKKNVIRGETTAKDDEEPQTRVTTEDYSYETPRQPLDDVDDLDDGYRRRSLKGITSHSSTTDSVHDKYRSSISASSIKTTRKSVSPDRKSPEHHSMSSLHRTSTNRSYVDDYSRRRDEPEIKSPTCRQSIADRLTQLSKKFSNDSLEKNLLLNKRDVTLDNQYTSYTSKTSSTYRSTLEGRSSPLSDAHKPGTENGTHERRYSTPRDDDGCRRGSSTPIEDVKESLYRKFSGSDEVEHSMPSFARVGKGGSVKALSQKFQQAAADAESPKSGASSYPKAGLILRSTSFKQTNGELTSPDSPGLKQSVSMEVRVGSPSRSGSTVTDYEKSRRDGGRSWSPSGSTDTCDRRVITQTTTEIRSDGTGSRSFLGNSSKVTGVQDIISRMRAADEETVPDDTSDDSEARALLNKFLGASAMMTGMEPYVKASGGNSSTLVSQVERQRILGSPTGDGYREIVTTTTETRRSSSDNIDDIWDEKKLRQLLDACTDYEGRRKLRARLRTVMAEKSACEELVAAAREDKDSNSKTVHRQGESLLPYLEQLRTTLKQDPRSRGGSSTEDGFPVPHLEDSGTESGEDFRLLAGLRESIREHEVHRDRETEDGSLLTQIQNNLKTLQTTLDSRLAVGKTLDAETRDGLLDLVVRLQESLKMTSGAAKSTDETKSPNKNRFQNKRLSRQNRHTVGVTKKELEDARRLLEENKYSVIVPDVEPTNDHRAEQDCVDDDVTGSDANVPLNQGLMKQNSVGDLINNPLYKPFRPVKFDPSKGVTSSALSNATAKPFSTSLDSPMSENESTLTKFYGIQPNNSIPQGHTIEFNVVPNHHVQYQVSPRTQRTGSLPCNEIPGREALTKITNGNWNGEPYEQHNNSTLHSNREIKQVSDDDCRKSRLSVDSDVASTDDEAPNDSFSESEEEKVTVKQPLQRSQKTAQPGLQIYQPTVVNGYTVAEKSSIVTEPTPTARKVTRINNVEKRIQEIQNENRHQGRQGGKTIEELQKTYRERKEKELERRKFKGHDSERGVQLNYQGYWNNQTNHLTPYTQPFQTYNAPYNRRKSEEDYHVAQKQPMDYNCSGDPMDGSQTESELSISSTTSTESSVSHAQKLLQMATGDNQNYQQHHYGKDYNSKKFSKRAKMKRSNTIDIPKPLNYYEIEGDTDYSDEEQRPSKPYGQKAPVPPRLDPKTESDRRFIAFLAKQSQPVVSNTIWRKDRHPSGNQETALSAADQWENRFSRIKTAFESPKRQASIGNQNDVRLGVGSGSGGSRGVRTFGKTADDSAAMVKSKGEFYATANGARLTREGSRFLRKLFDSRDAHEKPAKLPWTNPTHDSGVVIGSLTVASPKAHENLRPISKPSSGVNEFRHAPMSAFKPVLRKTPVMERRQSSLEQPMPVERPSAISTQSFESPQENRNPILPWIKDQGSCHRDNSVISTLAKFEGLSGPKQHVNVAHPMYPNSVMSSLLQKSPSQPALASSKVDFSALSPDTPSPRINHSFQVPPEPVHYNAPSVKRKIENFQNSFPSHAVGSKGPKMQVEPKKDKFKPITTYSVDVASTATVYNKRDDSPADHGYFLPSDPDTSASTPEEHVAVSKIMGSANQQQAVTVRSKTQWRDDPVAETKSSAVRNLANSLQRFSSPSEKSPKMLSPTKSSGLGLTPTRSPLLPPKLPTGKTSPFPPPGHKSPTGQMEKTLPRSLSKRTSSAESLVTSTRSEELKANGDAVVTSRLHIPYRRPSGQSTGSSPRDLSPGERHSTSPELMTTLPKSESYHQLTGQSKPRRPQSLYVPNLSDPSNLPVSPPRRSPNPLVKTKSSHALGFGGSSFEASFVNRASIEIKQKTVEEFLSQQKSPSARKKQTAAKKAVLELDDNLDNVDEAFDALFTSTVASELKDSQKSKTQLTKSMSAASIQPKRTTDSDCTPKTDSLGSSTRVTSKTTYTTTTSSSTSSTNKPISPFAKFQQLDRQNSSSAPSSPSAGKAPLFTFTDPKLCRSASGAKDRLLQWCQIKTKDYKNIQIENFSTSWSNGLAFCALIHHFRPEAFDYDSLTPKERRKNFELAFRVAEEQANIAPLLDVEDMVMMKKPDWKCVFTYVQSIYHRFKNEEI